MYKGRLKTGEQVAVKVQRPHVVETVSVDLHIIRCGRGAAQLTSLPSSPPERPGCSGSEVRDQARAFVGPAPPRGLAARSHTLILRASLGL